MSALKVIHVLLTLTNVLLFAGYLVILIIPYWSVTCKNCRASGYNLVYIHNGLWESCVNGYGGYSGNLNCVRESSTRYTSNGIMDTLKAFTIISVVLCGFSCLISFFGLPCFPLSKSKKKISLTSAGAIMMISSAFMLTSVTWYAVRVSYRYYNSASFEFYQENPTPVLVFTYGSCVYMGWVFGGLGLISGALLLCSTCGDEMDEDLEDMMFDPVEQWQRQELLSSVAQAPTYYTNTNSRYPENSKVYQKPNGQMVARV